MSDVQYEQYKNLIICATEWRHYTSVDKVKLTKDDFRTQMHDDKVVKLQFINSKSNRPVLILLFSDEASYTPNNQDLKRIFIKITDPTDVICVTKAPFKNYTLKTLRYYKKLKIKNYLHENFNLIVPLGPLCYPHRILSHEEINRLINSDLCCYLINLPKILVEDVQCIWIGCEVGDVVEIKSLSDVAGQFIHYRVVVPKNGNVISFRTDKVETVDAPNEEIEDEDIAEHRDDVGEKDDDSDIESEDE